MRLFFFDTRGISSTFLVVDFLDIDVFLIQDGASVSDSVGDIPRTAPSEYDDADNHKRDGESDDGVECRQEAVKEMAGVDQMAGQIEDRAED